MTEVVPAILPEDFDDLEARMARVRGHVDRVQIDIANGTYAPSTTWPFGVREHFEKLVHEDEGLPFWRELDVELDMLVMEPETYIDDWIHVGITAAIIHIETTKHYSQILQNYRIERGIEIGWGLRPNTENAKLFDIIDTHGMPDFVQVMGNDKIGYHGVALDRRVYDKVRAIRKQYPKLTLAVDIGVSEETAPQLAKAGVTKFVSSSAIFGSNDIDQTIDFFQNL